MSFYRTNWSGRTGHRTLLTYSLLVALVGVTAYKNRSLWWMHLLTKKCPTPNNCKLAGEHTHHLTPLGKWHYVYRFGLFTDPRPQPPVGQPWYGDYKKDWEENFPNVLSQNGSNGCQSAWVRDEKGYWVWITDTPLWDRDWFDKRGWQFPAKWITVGSQQFYTVGSDDISTIVSLEPQKEEFSQ